MFRAFEKNMMKVLNEISFERRLNCAYLPFSREQFDKKKGKKQNLKDERHNP